MKMLLNAMKKRNSGIPEDIAPIFEGIVKKYEARGVPASDPEYETEFFKAMEEHLTREQRFRLFEQNGACKGTGGDKERKAFALEHAHKPLDERVEILNKAFGRKIVLNGDNTLTVVFGCSHGYYKRVREKKYSSLPPSIESYFERCAGGRLYEYEKILGIKLRIKSVDISPLNENIANPVVFTFEIAG